jgi:TolB protein
MSERSLSIENPRPSRAWTGHPRFFLALALCLLVGAVAGAEEPLGIFQDHSDVGTVLHVGASTLDPAKQIYTLAGSGENMWATADAFQFAWKKVSGNVELSALVRFLNSGGNEHKKAVLIFRQSLEADSVYVDIALHGNGLLTLQYRDEKGGTTREIKSASPSLVGISTGTGANPVTTKLAQALLRLTRRGNYVYMSVGPPMRGDVPTYDGESIRVPLGGEFYVGIGVCAHDKDAVEEATFSSVGLENLPSSTGQPILYSTLETVPVSSGDRQVVYFAPGRFEAPNWSRDGKYLLFNRNGRLEKLAVSGGKPEVLDTGFADRLNNDHGISPDATQLAISDNSQETKSAAGAPSHDSLVYVVPINGGSPRRITKDAPSYWHGWSPDGKTLAFVGQRNGDFDIYAIPVTGGDETRLTTAKGLDDGPEYSPDGQYIYFNSERTGHMQIWRMKADGSDQEQVFSDDYNNWFPHISPDGKWIVFVTYEKDVTGHPENKDVMLRLMSLSSESNNDKKISVLAKLFGGQGTINVPSWSPDSKSVAFVSYQFIAPEDAAGASH